MKRSKISVTREAMPTKLDGHTFHTNLYLHIILEPILFFGLMDYSPCSEREIWPNVNSWPVLLSSLYYKLMLSNSNNDNNNETPTVRGLAADINNKLFHGNYDLLME